MSKLTALVVAVFIFGVTVGLIAGFVVSFFLRGVKIVNQEPPVPKQDPVMKEWIA